MARQGVGHLGPRLRGGGPRRHRPGRGRGRRGDRREAPGRAPPARRGGPRRRRVRRADPPSSGGEALMHVPDGFLAPQITVPAYLAAAPLWAWAARRHFGSRAVDALPVMGSLTALAFVLQTLRVPVPGGTSIHLVGATLLALLYGPLAAFVCESVVLAVQALFFGTGGVTTLAVNALAMGLLGPGAGWLAFRAARRAEREPARARAEEPHGERIHRERRHPAGAEEERLHREDDALAYERGERTVEQREERRADEVDRGSAGHRDAERLEDEGERGERSHHRERVHGAGAEVAARRPRPQRRRRQVRGDGDLRREEAVRDVHQGLTAR